MDKRLKCGEVFIWNNDSLTCAIECKLCEDRPLCKLNDFFEHLQAWHQEYDVDHDEVDECDDGDDDADDDDYHEKWKDTEAEKFECDLDQEESSEAEIEYETDTYDGKRNKEGTKHTTQPFEEVLIEVDGSEENGFEYSNDEKFGSRLGAVYKPYEEKQLHVNAGARVCLSIDDIAFKELKIQCSDIDTTQTTFESDFRQWCRQQQHLREIKCDSQTRSSEDSGVDKSETSSNAASASDDSDNFQINETNIKEQILFGINNPFTQSKLSSSDIEKLIELYQQHPRLWQQSHHEYNNAQKCRESWQEIKQKWNSICKRDLSEADIRIRLSTLRQRYLKERQRHEMHKENESFNTMVQPFSQRFRYYEKLSFLDEQKHYAPYTLQGVRISREYSKLIEIYAHFPILWNKYDAHHKSHAYRQRAYESICTALQLIGIHLSKDTVRLRLTTLKERYRRNKIQHLQCRLKGRTFVSQFKHYEQMKFLDRHVAPYHCEDCGSIFRRFNEYVKHSETDIQRVEKSVAPKLAPAILTCAGETTVTTTANEETVRKVQYEERTAENLMDNPSLAPDEYTKGGCDLVEVIQAAPDPILNNYQAKENSDKTVNTICSNVACDITIGETQQEYITKNIVENIEQTPQMPTTSYANEQSIVSSLQWANESFNSIPIYYLESQTLSSEYITAELTQHSTTEVQNLIVLNNDDTFLESQQLIFIDPQNIVMEPVIATTHNHDEVFKAPYGSLANTDVNNLGIDYENSAAKVYTNLVNTIFEETNVSANFITDNNTFYAGEIRNESLESSNEIVRSFQSAEVQVANEFPEELTLAIAKTLESDAYEKQTASDENEAAPKLYPPSNLKESAAFETKNQCVAGRAEVNSKKKAPIEITEVQLLKLSDAEVKATNISKKQTAETIGVQTRSSKALIANITSDNFQAHVDLSSCEPTSTVKKRMPYTLTRLTEPQILQLIELYRLTPQLWNPAHSNFDSRRHKRLSWRQLAMQFNASFYLNYNWLQIQRKMMDYIKYYKREQRRTNTKSSAPKWPFYEKLKFLDEVNANTTGLEKRMQQRKDTLKIIEIYKAHPQLWNTEHDQYHKRNQRQCTIAMMCSRLQEMHNITIEPAKLRQSLLDLRYNYRATKLARIEAEKRNEPFEAAARFEFYENLTFLETHLPPFSCENCKIEFKCLSDFSAHCKKEHKKSQISQIPLLANDIDSNTLDNVCHICGIKFTLRQNLVQHLNRHFKERSLACSHCDKKFFTANALDEHQRTHTKIPAVICPECGRTFFNTSKLTQHLKRHRNQRDYPCDQCGKAFYSAFERERHIRRHLNIRDKICPVCGKSFVAGSSYYAHAKLHNSKKEYSCTICKKEFAQYAGLYKHRRKYHP